jgi:hypothetical protein
VVVVAAGSLAALRAERRTILFCFVFRVGSALFGYECPTDAGMQAKSCDDVDGQRQDST